MFIQIALYVFSVVCAIWVIYDVWVYGRQDTGIKVLWTVLALFFSVLTAIVYAIGRKRR